MLKKFLSWLLKDGPWGCKHNVTTTEFPAMEARHKALHGDDSEMNTAPVYIIEFLDCGEKWSK